MASRLWTRVRIAREELRFLSARKLYNLALEAVAPRLRWVKLPYRPTKITVESGNVCNLRCPLCPTGQGDRSAQKGMLPYDTFVRILDQLGKDLITLRLYNWGEPLLNKHIVRMCELAYERRVSVKLSSHLNDLTPELAEGLLRAKVKKIYISADGATPESYAIYRRGGDWKRVMDNIRMLVAKKRELDAHFTRVIWLFHVFRHNEHEVPIARRLAQELGVELQLNAARTDMGKEIFETAEQALARDGHWLPEGDEFLAYDRDEKSAQREAMCTLPWKDTAINWDGKVLACCSVYSEKHHYGSIHEQDFGEIWNGEMYTEARREIVGQSPTKDTICKTCKHNGYLFL
ncbi:MAG TPA: radical SAM protein [Myxococcota bacterium]|nr:radical SAM protein [Myxococcota bacterium]